MDSIHCPKCDRPAPHKDWLNPTTGKQRYRCPDCGHTFYPGAVRGRPRSRAPKDLDGAQWSRVDWIRRKLEKNQTNEGVEMAIVSLQKEVGEGNPYAERFLHELQQNINGDEINLIK
ncbi:MAG: IS1/IS1595 family N-terminal zinc-binding domain-containing protein [Microcoleus sp.]